MWVGLGDRGLSTVVGVALMVVIVVLLVALTAASVTSLADDAVDSSQVHGVGHYSFDVAGDDDHLHVRPDAAASRSTTFDLNINGKAVHEWDGTSPVEVSCLYPGDTLTITTEKGDTTTLVQEHELETVLGCSLSLADRFKYVLIHTDAGTRQVELKTAYDFGLEIDPDGPGTDDTLGEPVHKRDIGPVPLSSEWHYKERFDRELHGIDPPVWLFIMTDNVHWRNVPEGHGHLNWTDSPPAGMTPGENAYDVDDAADEIDPINEDDTEPTNDVYMLFKPGCDESTVYLIDEYADYENQILLDGSVVVPNTDASGAEGSEFTAPPIPC